MQWFSNSEVNNASDHVNGTICVTRYCSGKPLALRVDDYDAESWFGAYSIWNGESRS